MSYYHQVTIGFNWYYIVVPAVLCLAFIFGRTKYKLDIETFTILKRGGGDLLLKMVSVVLDTLVHIMILVESGAGMLQMTANCLPDSDIAWAPVILGMWFVVIYILFYRALFSLGKIGESAKRKQLFKLRKKLIKRKKEQMGASSVARDPRERIIINL